MQLKEVVNELLEKKFAGSTRAMATVLGVSEMDIRRLTGIDPGTRRNQNKLFQIFLKIVPLCQEIGIDLAAAEDLTEQEREQGWGDLPRATKTRTIKEWQKIALQSGATDSRPDAARAANSRTAKNGRRHS